MPALRRRIALLTGFLAQARRQSSNVMRNVLLLTGQMKSRGITALAALLIGNAIALPLAAQQAAEGLPTSMAYARAVAGGSRDSSGRPGPAYWQSWNEYSISARLEPRTGVVTGRATVVAFNRSPDIWRVVHLRLDQNLFRRDAPHDVERPDTTDGIILTRLSVDGRIVQIDGRSSELPVDWLEGSSTTNAVLHLAQPIPAGKSVHLEMEWHFEIPEDDKNASVRMGRSGDSIFQVAQWYPRIAMYDDLNGWDKSLYLGEAEFYNPFGRFDVRIAVPDRWLVAATGVLQNPAEVLREKEVQSLRAAAGSDTAIVIAVSEAVPQISGWREWHFVADSVSDFAWGTSPQSTWVGVRGGNGAPFINVLYSRRNAERAREVAERARDLIAAYSAILVPYVYTQLTVIDGPERGMEYPMLLMTDGGTLPHEVWHQWWPAMVGSNETWYSFMDEGLAVYSSSLASSRDGENSAPRRVYASRGGRPLVVVTDTVAPPPNIAGYGLPSAILSELENVVGRPAVVTALRAYARAWRFKHPSPWDFMALFETELKRDLTEFWKRWVFSPS